MSARARWPTSETISIWSVGFACPRVTSVGSTVIGGFVYRGSEMPAQRGRYFFGDEGSSWIKSADARTLKNRQTLGFTVSALYSFGENSKGELYVISGAGPVYKLVDN